MTQAGDILSESRPSRLASALVNAALATKDHGLLPTALFRVLSLVRRAWLSAGDPTVEVMFCGRLLLMPLSHQLPFYARSNREYSLNLGRVYQAIREKYGEIAVIDIGANIGDSAAILTQHGGPPILCVEGESTFLHLLKANTRAVTPQPVIEPVFVAAPSGTTTARVARGTARLQGFLGSQSVPCVEFRDLLNRHPAFEHARLLKIDTDGMDVAIIRSAMEWIERRKPVLFFEYDPDLQKEHGGGGLDLLHDLFDLGYSTALAYDNKGDYMLTMDLDDRRLLADIDAYFSGRRSLRYVDLCAFHSSDRSVAEHLRAAEIALFRALRAK